MRRLTGNPGCNQSVMARLDRAITLSIVLWLMAGRG
jgi:hypothetical protein